MKIIILFFFLILNILQSYSQTDSLYNVVIQKADENNSEKNRINLVDEKPEYIGGVEEMFQFISKNLLLKKTEQELNSKIYLVFDVNSDGTLSNIKADTKHKNDPILETELIRIVKLMPKWKPAKLNNKAIKSEYKIPIVICLRQ